MEVIAGYKQTEVGIIPEEWGVVDVGSLISYGPRNGYSGRSGKNARGTPTLALTATSSGRMILNGDTVKFLEETLDHNSEILLKSGDVLVQRSNTLELVGTTAIFNGPNDTFAYPDLMTRLRFISPETSQWFWRFANSTVGRRYFTSVAAGSTGTMPKLSGDKIRSMPIPLPSQFEQKAIATVLSDVDTLLDGLDQLISKKRDLKQATMRQLLTGQTRLPGFQGEWEVKSFGELTIPRRERIDPRTTSINDFCIELEHIESGNGKILGYTSTSTQSSLKAVFYPEDVLFGKLRAYLRKYWRATRSGVCSTEIWVLIPRDGVITSEFLLHVIQTDSFIETASNSYGTHMPRSDWSIVKNFELKVPGTPEQIAIASVLSDMDEELAALEKRRDKTQSLKLAMMQELLTGRTRLVDPNASIGVANPFAGNRRRDKVARNGQEDIPTQPIASNWE